MHVQHHSVLLHIIPVDITGQGWYIFCTPTHKKKTWADVVKRGPVATVAAKSAAGAPPATGKPEGKARTVGLPHTYYY